MLVVERSRVVCRQRSSLGSRLQRVFVQVLRDIAEQRMKDGKEPLQRKRAWAPKLWTILSATTYPDLALAFELVQRGVRGARLGPAAPPRARRAKFAHIVLYVRICGIV